MLKYKNMTYTKRADGRLVKKIVQNKKPIYLYSHDEKELYNQYIKSMNDINMNKTIIAKNSITIADYSNYWYEHYIKDSKLADSTKRDYNDCIRLYIIPNIGNYRISDIREVDINDLMIKLSKDGITRRREMTLNILKNMFNKAKKNNIISENYISDISIEKHIAKEKKPLSMKVIDTILSMPNELDESVFMMKLILTTGVRLEEVSPLEKKDIIKDIKRLSINKVVDLDSKDLKIKYYTKNKETRKVPILDIIYDDLINRANLSSNKLLFPNKYGKLKSRTSFKRDLERFLKILNKYYEEKQKEKDKNFKLTEENIITFTYHQLRHSYACVLHKADIDLKTAQSFTGHKDLKVLLEIYTHLDEEDINNAQNKLNKFFNKKDKKVVKRVVKYKGTFKK